MKTVKMTILLLSTMVLGACTSDAQIVPKKIKIEQLQYNWKLTHVDNIKLATVINSSLAITAQNEVSGNLGCNNFFGQAALNNNQLLIDKMGATRMMCSNLKNDVEMDVSQVLSALANVMVDNKTLIISNNKHSLTYQRIDNAINQATE